MFITSEIEKKDELLTVEELTFLLNNYKGILNKEMFEYLESIINSEFSVIKENISDENRNVLSELEIYKKAAIYNIYSRAINLLKDKDLDIIPLNNRLDINSNSGDRLFNFSFGEYSFFGNRDIPTGYKTMKIGTIDLYHTLEGKNEIEAEKYMLLDELHKLYNKREKTPIAYRHQTYRITDLERRYRELYNRQELTLLDKEKIELSNYVYSLLIEDYGIDTSKLKEEHRDSIHNDKTNLKKTLVKRMPNLTIRDNTKYI